MDGKCKFESFCGKSDGWIDEQCKFEIVCVVSEMD